MRLESPSLDAIEYYDLLSQGKIVRFMRLLTGSVCELHSTSVLASHFPP